MEITEPDKSTYHHGNLRRALIASALEIISEKGSGNLTIREIARRSGVSHTAPYRHFRDKDELLSAVAREGFDMMIKEAQERIAKHPGEYLIHFGSIGMAYIDFAISYPAHYRVMFGAGDRKGELPEDLKPESTSSFTLLYDTIKKCQDEAIIKEGDVNEMALFAWATVHGFAMLLIDGHIIGSTHLTDDLDRLKLQIVKSIYYGLTT